MFNVITFIKKRIVENFSIGYEKFIAIKISKT